MLRTAFLQSRNEPSRVNHRKAPTDPPVRARSQATFFSRILAPAFTADALSCADLIKPPRPCVRATILPAEPEQGGKRP